MILSKMSTKFCSIELSGITVQLQFRKVLPGTEGTTKTGETTPVTAEPTTTGTFTVSAKAPLAAGEGCVRTEGDPRQVTCATLGPARWLMADLGPGNDELTVEGSLEAVDFVRVNGGEGNDTIHGGPEEDLLQSGPGSDHVYGGDGSDGLIGGLPGPTLRVRAGDRLTVRLHNGLAERTNLHVHGLQIR